MSSRHSTGTVAAISSERRQAEIARNEAKAKHDALVAEADQRQRAERNEQEARDQEQYAKTRESETAAVLGFVENKIFAAARPKGQEGGLGFDVKLEDAIGAALPDVETSFTDHPLIEIHSSSRRVRRNSLNLSDCHQSVSRQASTH
jgi:hypothetical protein